MQKAWPQRSSEATCPLETRIQENIPLSMTTASPVRSRLKYPDVYNIHMCVAVSLCVPVCPPCYLQCFHAVCLSAVFGSLCTFMFSLYDYESYGVLWCICLLSLSLSLCITCVFPCRLCVVCMCVGVCLHVVCVYISVYLCAVFLLSLMSPCELVWPWYACLHVTCVSLCLCVHHMGLYGLSSVVCCLAYFLWPPRQFL